MPRSRPLLAALLVLGLLTALVPAVAMANGGSAGDNQYVDPLAGVHSHGGSSASSSASSAASTTSTPAATAAAPTATTPTSSTSAAASSDPKGKSSSLPYTGFQDWQAAGLGLMLVAGGLGLRRRTRRVHRVYRVHRW